MEVSGDFGSIPPGRFQGHSQVFQRGLAMLVRVSRALMISGTLQGIQGRFMSFPGCFRAI